MSIPKQFIILALVLLCMQSHADWPWAKKSDAVAPKNKPQTTHAQLKNGMTEQEVMAKLGEPRALIENGSKKIMMYSGVKIELQNNREVHLPANFSAQQNQGKEKQVHCHPIRVFCFSDVIAVL